VTKSLRQVGYTGWLTIEGSGTSEELDLIIEGK
jgi:sugar phosphate isomerase/epimerase